MPLMKQPEDLSVKERAVLFALMGEAREISNPELEERAGFRLDGKERRRLNNLKLVDSRMVRRAYVHELTDAGWHWCATELSVGLHGKVTSIIEVESTSTEQGKQSCLTAITMTAPYGDWTDDMIAVLGQSQDMTFQFYYQ